MIERSCKTCKYFSEHIGPGGWWETCDRAPMFRDGHGLSASFERDAMGACGTEGRYWREK